MTLVSRLVSALGGLILLGLAWGLFGYPIVQTIQDPAEDDFPGGKAGVVIMLLLMGSVPLGGGIMLIRRALHSHPTDTGAAAPAGSRSASNASGTTALPAGAPPAAVAAVATPQPTSSAATSPAAVAAIARAASIGRERRAALLARLQTSFGLGAALLAVAMTLSIAFRAAAPLIAPLALLIFSLIDPLMNVGRPSWWRGTFGSALGWFVLYIVLAPMIDVLSDDPDATIGFVLPFAAFPLMVALSGVLRLFEPPRRGAAG
jgi:hypothetical protein